MAYRACWRSLSVAQVADLRALSTRVDLAPGPGGSRITPLGPLTAAGRAVVPFAAEAVLAIVALYPSSQLVAHADPPIAGRRFHVPITINPGCWVFHAGTWQQLEEGRVYEMDPTALHGAVNWGSTVRLHLLLDTETAC